MCRPAPWRWGGRPRSSRKDGRRARPRDARSHEASVMCGIVGYVGDKSAVGIIVEGLKRLEDRRYDSAGVAVLLQGALHVRRGGRRVKVLHGVLDERPPG